MGVRSMLQLRTRQMVPLSTPSKSQAAWTQSWIPQSTKCKIRNSKFSVDIELTSSISVPLLLVGCLCLPIKQNILTKLLSRISITELCVYPLCLQAIYPVVSQSDQTPPDAHVCTDQAHTETILQAVSIYCTLTQGVIFLLMYVQCTLYNRHNSSVSLYSVYIIQSCILPIIPSMMMWGAHNQQRRKLSIMLFS